MVETQRALFGIVLVALGLGVVLHLSGCSKSNSGTRGGGGGASVEQARLAEELAEWEASGGVIDLAAATNDQSGARGSVGGGGANAALI